MYDGPWSYKVMELRKAIHVHCEKAKGETIFWTII